MFFLFIIAYLFIPNYMFNILSNITLRNITTAGVVLTVVIYLCTSCRNNHAEVERIIRNHLEPTKELYALALQTGEVTLPLGGKYPHVTYQFREVRKPLSAMYGL